MSGPDSIFDVLLREYLFKLSQRGWRDQVDGVLALAENGPNYIPTATYDNHAPAPVLHDYVKPPKKPKALRGRP